jgi:hypothetical protein
MREDFKPSDTKEEKVTHKNIRIPLATDDALAVLLRVKPTKDMPRPGANPATKKRAAKKTPARSPR